MIRKRVCLNSLWIVAVTFLMTACGLQHEWVFDGQSVPGVHSRGLYVKDSTIIITGSKGVFSTYNFQGEQLSLDSVPEVQDFRDVMMFNDGSMSLMEGSNNSHMVHVNPKGGKKIVYRRSATFIDGMDFWDDQNGIAYGDPWNLHFYLLRTTNSGQKWLTLSRSEIERPKRGEAGLAASGTGIQCIGDSIAIFGTGCVDTPRVFITADRGDSWNFYHTPMKGGETGGIYSLFFWTENDGVIIGGDYRTPEARDSICYRTSDQGKTWTDASKGLGGYCSTVQGREDGALLIASGRVGTYYSLDQGKKWKKLTDKKFYSCFVTDTHVVFSGKDGAFAIMAYEL